VAPLIIIGGLCFAAHCTPGTSEVCPLESCRLALKQNSDLRLVEQSRGNQYPPRGTRADELPQVKTDAAVFGIAKTQNLTIPRIFGQVSGWSVAWIAGLIDQGSHSSSLQQTVEQPLTQLIRLRAARRPPKQCEYIASRSTQGENRSRYNAPDLHNSSATRNAGVGLQVSCRRAEFEGKHRWRFPRETCWMSHPSAEETLLQSKYQLANAKTDFRSDRRPERVDPFFRSPRSWSFSHFDGCRGTAAPRWRVSRSGIEQNPEIQAATAAATKPARCPNPKADYIPMSGFRTSTRIRNGVPFLPHNNGSTVCDELDVFDWETAPLGEAEARQTQAERISNA